MPTVGGDIEMMPVSDIAVWAADRHVTGTLTVRRHSVETRFTLREGVCVQASSTDPREYLGQHLINFGYIDEDQLQRAFDTQKETKVPLGRVLVMVEAITTEQLQRVLLFKTREALLEALCWTAGSWKLSPEADGDIELDCDQPVDLREVASEAAARQQMWGEIRRVFPSDATRVDVLVNPDGVSSSFDRRLLLLMKGGRSVGEAALELRAMDFQTYARLYDLASRELVKPLITSAPVRVDQFSPHELAAAGASFLPGEAPDDLPILIPRTATPSHRRGIPKTNAGESSRPHPVAPSSSSSSSFDSSPPASAGLPAPEFPAPDPPTPGQVFPTPSGSLHSPSPLEGGFSSPWPSAVPTAAGAQDDDIDIDVDEASEPMPAAPGPPSPSPFAAPASPSPSPSSPSPFAKPAPKASLSETPVANTEGGYFGAGTYMMVKPERASEAPGVKVPPEAEDPAKALRVALAGRNWSEALLLSQRILEHDPLDSEAIAAFRVADTQLRRLEKQGGSVDADFEKVPTMAMARDEVALAHLTSKERYVLSRVDGQRSLQQIAAVSPIQRTELIRIVDGFVQRGVLRY